MKEAFRTHTLVVDPDLSFSKLIQSDPIAKKIVPIIVHSEKQAEQMLEENQNSFLGVFLNPKISSFHGLSVIRCQHYNRPMTPLFIIHDEAQVEFYTSEHIKQLGVRQVLRKPITYSKMVEFISPLVVSFDSRLALEKAKMNKDVVGQTVINDGSSFISVCAEDFLSGSTAYFDVYIQLSSGRYLKLLHAGDAFSSDRLESYIKKGVTHFYIRKEVQEQFLSYCGHLTTMMLPAENISSEIKVSQTLNFGEQTMSFLEQQGISEERLKYAHKFVASVKSLIAQIKPSQASELQHFLDDVSAHEHGVSTAMLAGLLANAVEITMTRPASIVGIAAFLHDVGLFKMPKGFRDEDESYLSPTEQKLFEKHPQIGAEILGKIRGIDPAAVQAVGQHHVRRNGKGFPQLHSVSVNRIAEIVGICDEFSHLLKKYQNKPSWSGILSELEAKVFPGFSRQIVYAFRSTFFPKTRQQEVRKNTAEVFAIA